MFPAIVRVKEPAICQFALVGQSVRVRVSAAARVVQQFFPAIGIDRAVAQRAPPKREDRNQTDCRNKVTDYLFGID